MSPAERKWLQSYNPRTGSLDKAVARRADIAIATLMMVGLIKNVGPDEPNQWNLQITPAGLRAIGERASLTEE